MIIEDFAKIPYLKNGRSEAGADCYGAVILYFRHLLGIELQDFPGENRSPEHNARMFIDKVHLEFAPVQQGQERQHDIVLLLDPYGRPNHVGVMIDRQRLLQLSSEHGCSIIRLSRFGKRIHGIYRHRDLK